MFIIHTTDLSFQGTTLDENTTVSHFIISTALCLHSAILESAENCSHWLQVVIITCLWGRIHSVAFGVIFLITPGFIFKYQSSFAIATFSIILLQLRKIVLSCFSQMLASCWILEIHEEKAAIISLHLWCSETIVSNASQTFFSLIEYHFLVEPVESDKNIVIHVFQILWILSKSAGSSISGVWSILKSQVCINLVHVGDSITNQFFSHFKRLSLLK